jgi:NADP-dependent 3-hydroxy acid dehydrogenase YdfG
LVGLPRERRRALVTGASGGVGAAIARAFGSTHDLLLGGRDSHTLEELASTLPSARPWVVDLTDLEAVAKATAQVDCHDVLVHSAGSWEPGRVSETTPGTWRRLFDINVFAVAELTRLLLPALRAAQGRVILINSSAGKHVSPARGAYAASKFALRAYGDALHAEEAENGVRVTSIYPGRVATDMQRGVRDDEGGPFEPKKYLAPESVALAVLTVATAPADTHVKEIVIQPTLGRSTEGPHG